MNGQVVPVSGGSLDGTSERAERKVKGEEKRGGIYPPKGSNHGGTVAHSRVISYVARTPGFTPPLIGLTP